MDLEAAAVLRVDRQLNAVGKARRHRVAVTDRMPPHRLRHGWWRETVAQQHLIVTHRHRPCFAVHPVEQVQAVGAALVGGGGESSSAGQVVGHGCTTGPRARVVFESRCHGHVIGQRAQPFTPQFDRNVEIG